MSQPLPNSIASSSNNAQAALAKAKKGQLVVMTTAFIWEQIDMGLNDLMFELSKQLVDIVKPIVQN